MTTRRWMVVVAAAAVVVGLTIECERRYRRFRRLYHLHLRSATMVEIPPSGPTPETRRLAAYHLALVRKYGQASLWPWLPVAPDPPPPD